MHTPIYIYIHTQIYKPNIQVCKLILHKNLTGPSTQITDLNAPACEDILNIIENSERN